MPIQGIQQLTIYRSVNGMIEIEHRLEEINKLIQEQHNDVKIIEDGAVIDKFKLVIASGGSKETVDRLQERHAILGQEMTTNPPPRPVDPRW